MDCRALGCTLWIIWKERCKSAFDATIPSPRGVLIQIKAMLAELAMLTPIQAQGTSQREGRLHAMVSWKAPPEGTVKINVDASWHKDMSFCATGLIARDSRAVFVAGDCRRLRGPSPVIAEALALREGIVTAHNLGLDRIILESDCLNLVEACKGGKQVGEAKVIVEDILKLQVTFQSCSFSWCSRNWNKAAHLTANACLHNTLAAGWTFHPPMPIALALSEDARHIPPRD